MPEPRDRRICYGYGICYSLAFCYGGFQLWFVSDFINKVLVQPHCSFWFMHQNGA